MTGREHDEVKKKIKFYSEKLLEVSSDYLGISGAAGRMGMKARLILSTLLALKGIRVTSSPILVSNVSVLLSVVPPQTKKNYE